MLLTLKVLLSLCLLGLFFMIVRDVKHLKQTNLQYITIRIITRALVVDIRSAHFRQRSLVRDHSSPLAFTTTLVPVDETPHQPLRAVNYLRFMGASGYPFGLWTVVLCVCRR